MTQIWQSYQTDLGNVYPFQPLNIRQLSNNNRANSPLLILLASDLDNLIEFNGNCSIKGLIHRKIKVFFSDDTVYEFNYYRPFSNELFLHLS
ncbi:MAG: hypothetical protein AAFY21_10770, partial [Cyanobacteria bacterium J06641_2]